MITARGRPRRVETSERNWRVYSETVTKHREHRVVADFAERGDRVQMEDGCSWKRFGSTRESATGPSNSEVSDIYPALLAESLAKDRRNAYLI